MAGTSFDDANARYEAGLRAAFGDALVAADLAEKRRKMRKSAFLFLRATCFRWAERATALCPELVSAWGVGAVVDAHAGNFGLWRDAHMRLVWGVNDYDEAARAPWPFDLVRLAASLILALDDGHAGEIADAIVEGYAAALQAPAAFVLERDHLWLRDAFAASDKERGAFWATLAAAPPAPCNPASLEAPLREALGPAASVHIAPRPAGAGSLGRPRFTAMGQVSGGPIAAEIKAVLPSVWTAGREPGLSERLAHGGFRSPDPTHHYRRDHVVRRLAPNNRKLDFDKLDAALHARLFAAMAAELASIHAADGAPDRIARELAAMPPAWLKRAAKTVAAWTDDEWSAFRRSTPHD